MHNGGPNAAYPHGLACDGCGIAKDDVRGIQMLQERDEILQELFQNAARLRTAMKSNALLRPIFRKYQRACREILNRKRREAEIFTEMCDYCDAYKNNNTDLKLIQHEMREIHDKIKSLEEMQLNESDSDSDSDDMDSDDMDSGEQDQPQDQEPDDADDVDVDVDDASSVSSSSSSSSSSSFSYDIEDFL